MCGIVGSISHQSMAQLGQAVLNSIQHRGPDAQGDFCIDIGHQQIWLGHTRLSILDASQAGAQPMQSAQKTWTVVFNGEIYNHHDLRKQLKHDFCGHSDTETLTEALDAWGIEKTLPQLNGMYAFAALDHQRKKLHLLCNMNLLFS